MKISSIYQIVQNHFLLILNKKKSNKNLNYSKKIIKDYYHKVFIVKNRKYRKI